jgi:hypothetical protein
MGCVRLAVGGWRLVKATAVAGKNAVDGSN